MPESERPLFRSFPMPNRDAWPGLKERAAEYWPSGFAWEALYTEMDALPPAPPPGTGDHTRGVREGGGVHATRVGCQVSLAGADETRAAIGQQVDGGADLIWLRNAYSADPGCSDAAVSLARALADVDLRGRALVLDAGPETARIGRDLFAHRSGEGPARGGASPPIANEDPVTGCTAARGNRLCEVSLAVDPLAWLVSGSVADHDLDAAMAGMLAAARWSSETTPGWRSVMVSGTPHREAGATSADEIAAVVGTGLHYLRAMVADGLSADAAAREVQFVLSIGRDVFAEIAKLRALRRLWSRVVRAVGGSAEARAAAVYVRSAGIERTGYGRWINQLRATAEGFAAWVGGADGLVLAPFDSSPDGIALGRRLARTTQHILAEEAHLGRVADPAGGSWFLEAITDRLARVAWDAVRGLEAQGGIAAALRDGSLDQVYARHAAKHAHDVATRRDRWVGVTAFPDREETRDETTEEAASCQASAARLLRVRRPTAAFEALRAASDRVAAAEGRPTIILVTVGSQADYQGPVSVASRALAVGGIATEEHHATEAEAPFARSGSKTAVICGADAALRDEGPTCIDQLRAAGARLLLVTAPRDAEVFWHQAGADLLLDEQFDLYAILCRVHAELGIRSGAQPMLEARA